MTRRRTLRGRLRPATRGEAGFTLPELIVAIALETIIFGALATAFIVVLNGGDSVNENLTKSSDARFAANYIISDARNSSGPEISLTDATSCPDPTPPVAGPQTAVARFNWNSPNVAGTTTANITDYVLVSGSLVRRHCEAGVLVSDGVLAVSIATVAVSCSPITDCTGAPTSVTVTITETPDKNGLTYSYTLTAAFRKLVGGGSSLTPSPPQSLVIFGSGGCGIDVSGGSTIGLKVFGKASINAVDNGSCKAINLSGSGIFSAGTTSILQGGTCVASGGSHCPVWSSYPTPIGDPYAGLAVPPAQPNQTNGCGGTSGSFTTPAGTYTTPFVVQGSVNCTLASGIYIFKAGFSITAGATLTTAPGGVLLYLTGGAFNIDGAGNVTLAAMTTGTYSGLVVWQAAADMTTFNLAAGGVVAFSGAIYVPKAKVLISGNAQGTRATSIVAQTIVMQGSAGMIVGASLVPLSITGPTTLQAWTVNQPYPSTTMVPAGGDGSYAWSATGLPNLMSINASSGIISGSPTVAGTVSVVVTLNDALGDDPDTQTLSLTINAGLVITTASPLPGGEKTAPYSTTLARTGGTAPFLWSQTGLPAGMTLNASTGIISGPATATGAPTVNITLADSTGASVTKGLVLTITAQPTIVSVTLKNVASGGTAGWLDKGDTIAIVFSAPMDVSSICSAWATDTNNQSLVANNDVTVTVNDGVSPTHDTITVTSAACSASSGTLNFGTLDLGVSTYVGTGSAVFKGASTSKSTITWTVSTNTLLITLGAKGATGTVATVTTSTPSYTAGAILDSAGASLGNSPFPIAAGQKF